MHVHIYDGEEDLAHAVACAFARSAAEATKARGRFVAALAGGSTPTAMYRRLANGLAGPIDWSRVHLFWTDERLVPADHPESNFRMVQEAMLRHVPIPSDNIHRPQTAGCDAEQAARGYEAELRAFFGDQPVEFDWVLLGLGEDGHVASLFPAAATLQETARPVVAVTDSPKPPPMRVTLTLPVLNAAREVHFMVSGDRKRAIYSKISVEVDGQLPAQRVCPRDGTVDWWVDRQAAIGRPAEP